VTGGRLNVVLNWFTELNRLRRAMKSPDVTVR
jgi:hypothetical protein